jgi:hypothetical protein
LPPTFEPLNSVSLPFTGSSTTGRARPTPVPVPILDLLEHPLGPLACSAGRAQRGNLLELYFPPFCSLITMRFRIGGWGLPGSVTVKSTFSPVDLPAFAGVASALNTIETAP